MGTRRAFSLHPPLLRAKHCRVSWGTVSVLLELQKKQETRLKEARENADPDLVITLVGNKADKATLLYFKQERGVSFASS